MKKYERIRSLIDLRPKSQSEIGLVMIVSGSDFLKKRYQIYIFWCKHCWKRSQTVFSGINLGPR